MKNGFYHQQPNGEDIAVSSELLAEIGCSVNAVVVNSRYNSDRKIVADCWHNGQAYLAVRTSTGWMLVSKA